MTNENKKIIFDIITNVITIAFAGFLIFGSTFILNRYTNLFNNSEQEPNQGEKITLEKDLPEVPAIGGQEPIILQIFTKEKPFNAPANIFNDSVYEEHAQRIALLGEFSYAEFFIKGETKNEKNNFLSVNLGNISGVYGIGRLKDKDIEVYSDNAIFAKEKPLDISINLITAQTRLSGTLPEAAKGIVYKDLYLWQHIQPPPEQGTVVKFLFIPFAEDGTIGETTINNLEFHYGCVEEGECEAILCEKGESSVKCLERMGKGSSKNYVKYFKK